MTAVRESSRAKIEGRVVPGAADALSDGAENLARLPRVRGRRGSRTVSAFHRLAASDIEKSVRLTGSIYCETGAIVSHTQSVNASFGGNPNQSISYRFSQFS